MTRARMPRPHEVAAARRDPRLLRAFHERDEDLTWRVRGVCHSVDPEVFFPAPGEPADAAVSLCRTCEVQGACLAWALEAGDCHGVWGATTAARASSDAGRLAQRSAQRTRHSQRQRTQDPWRQPNRHRWHPRCAGRLSRRRGVLVREEAESRSRSAAGVAITASQ